MTTATEKVSTELAELPPAETALAVFSAPKGMDPWLQKIRTEIESFVPDVSTKKGRDSIASMAYKVAQVKNALDGVGKKVSADLKLIPKKVDAERKRVWDTLESWQEEVRRPLNEWQAREDARIDGHNKILDWLAGLLAARDDMTLDQMRQQLGEVEAFEISEALEEFEAEAARGKDKAITALREQIGKREKHEAELAAIAKFNAEQAERDAQAERDRIAREAAEQATREAEQRAQAERDAAAKREQDLIDQATERQRQAEQDKRDAEAAAEQARLNAELAEQRRIAAEKQAELDRIEADKRAERERMDAIERQARAVEQARLDEVERQRRETDEAERQAKAREDDKAHKARINRAALDAFVAGGMTEECAKQAVILIASRKIPSVSITY